MYIYSLSLQDFQNNSQVSQRTITLLFWVYSLMIKGMCFKFSTLLSTKILIVYVKSELGSFIHTNSRAHSYTSTTCVFTMHFQAAAKSFWARQWCDDFKLDTILSHCHWMCFMWNKNHLTELSMFFPPFLLWKPSGDLWNQQLHKSERPPTNRWQCFVFSDKLICC